MVIIFICISENKMSKKVSKIPLQFKVARPEPTFVLDDGKLMSHIIYHI